MAASAARVVRVLDDGAPLLPGPAVELVVDVSPLLALDNAAAQHLAAVVGLARAPVGRPATAQRAQLATGMAATVVRRLARAAGLANRLKVAAAPGEDGSEVTVRWPAGRYGEALAAAAGRLVLLLAELPDEGRMRAALRDEAAAVAGS